MAKTKPKNKKAEPKQTGQAAAQDNKQTQGTGKPAALPGTLGKDYYLARYGGRYYVVYNITVGGKAIRLSWRVSQQDMQGFGIDPKKAKRVTQNEYNAFNYFGNAREIAGAGTDLSHPFDQWLGDLREQYGGASWLEDPDVVGIFLMGQAEGWSPDEIFNRVKQTRWFQKKTEYQRRWDLDMSKKEKDAQLDIWGSEISTLLTNFFGPVNYLDHISQADIDKYVLQVASGFYGDPQDGFNFLQNKFRTLAEKIEGTPSWMERQQANQEVLGYQNEPENRYEQVRADALRWLGPRGMLDGASLRQWSKELVAGTKSDADWAKFLRRQAQALYPYLGPDEPWQDRAGSYKAEAESLLEQGLDWDDPLLEELGGFDKTGKPHGGPESMTAFRRRVRSSSRWWQTDGARDEGVGILSFLNNSFWGVQ